MYPETTKSAKPWKIKFSVPFGTEREVFGEKGNIFKMSCTSVYCKMPCKHVLAVMIHKVDCHGNATNSTRKRSLPTTSDGFEKPGTGVAICVAKRIKNGEVQLITKMQGSKMDGGMRWVKKSAHTSTFHEVVLDKSLIKMKHGILKYSDTRLND